MTYYAGRSPSLPPPSLAFLLGHNIADNRAPPSFADTFRTVTLFSTPERAKRAFSPVCARDRLYASKRRVPRIRGDLSNFMFKSTYQTMDHASFVNVHGENDMSVCGTSIALTK
jgi:hypothetical protein